MNKTIILFFIILIFSSLVLAESKAVIEKIEISVDDVEFNAYDSSTGKGVVAIITDDDGLPGGKKTFKTVGGSYKNFNDFKNQEYNSYTKANTQWVKYNNGVPIIESDKHSRVYMRGTVKNLGSTTLNNVYIHPYVSYPKENLYPYGMNRHKEIETLNPLEIKESIISFDIENFPDGYFYTRYQFGTWHYIWYDSVDYRDEDQNIYCPTCVYPWFSKPFIYFTGSNYNFPEITIMNDDSNNLFGDIIIPDGIHSYSADFQIKNTQSTPQKIVYYQTLYSWWPNQYRFRFDPFWKINAITKTLNPNEIFTSSLATTFTKKTTSNVHSNEYATQQQLLGSYFYIYLKDDNGKTIPLRQSYINYAGHEKEKFLYVWYATPQVTISDDGTPMLKTLYGFYKHLFKHSDANEEINPGDLQVQFKVINTLDNTPILDETIDINNYFCPEIGTGPDQDNKIELLVKPLGGNKDLKLAMYRRQKKDYGWKSINLKSKLTNDVGDGWYKVSIDLLNDMGLKNNDLVCNIYFRPTSSDFLIDDLYLVSSTNTKSKLLDDYSDLLSGQYAWWGIWKEPIKASDARPISEGDTESFKITPDNSYYIVNHWLKSDVEFPITPDDLDKNYLLQIITKRNGVNNWYRSVYFTATPLLSSLDQNKEVHLCPKKDLTTFYRRNLIFNGQDYNVYPDITATEYSDVSDSTTGIIQNDPYVFVPSKGGSTTYIKYEYSNIPSNDLSKNLDVKVSYYDELMNEIKDEKSIPIYIHDNKDDSAYCIDYMDITPLKIDVRRLFLNYNNEVETTIANIGNLDSSSFNVELTGYESGTTNQVYSQTKTVSVQGGEEKVIIFDIKPTNSNYQQYDFSLIVDPDNNLVETNPHKKADTIQSVAEINNEIKAYKVPVYEYDASTEFFEGYDEENDKRLHSIMANRGNVESLMENTVDYENLYSSGTYNSFPTTIDILLGNFNDDTIDLDKVNTLLEASDTINNFDIYGTDGAGVISYGSAVGEGRMTETENNFLLNKNLWDDTNSIDSGIYQMSSESEIINDLLASNNLSVKEFDICNEDIVGDFRIVSDIEEPMFLWQSTDTLLASFNINTDIEEFIEFRVEIDCPSELDCEITVPNQGVFSFEDPINNYIDINVYTDIKTRNNVCPVNQNYDIKFKVIYSSHLDVCDQEFTEEFDYNLNLNSGGYCQCEISLIDEFTGECDFEGQDNCYAELDEMCCGDDENELWNFEFEQCEQLVDNVLCEEGTCDSEAKEICIENVWNSELYCDSCSDSTCEGSCDVLDPCDADTKSVCVEEVWQNPLFDDYCLTCGEGDSDCADIIDTCEQDSCDVTNKKYCDNDEWLELNYCDKCSFEDSSCSNDRQVCEDLQTGEQGLCNLETETNCWDGTQCCEETTNEFWSQEYDTCDPTEIAKHETIEIDEESLDETITDILNDESNDVGEVPVICQTHPEVCTDTDSDGEPDAPDLSLVDINNLNPNDNPLSCEISVDDVQGDCDINGEFGCWDEYGPDGNKCCWTENECWADTQGNGCCYNSNEDRSTYLTSSNADNEKEFCEALCEINNPLKPDADCWDEINEDQGRCCGNQNDETWSYLSNTQNSCINGLLVDDPDNSGLACAVTFGKQEIDICDENFDKNCYDDIQNKCCGDDGDEDLWVNVIDSFSSTACINGVYMTDPDNYTSDNQRSWNYCHALKTELNPSSVEGETMYCDKPGETYCTINTELVDDLIDKSNLCCGDDESETFEYITNSRINNLAPNLCYRGEWVVSNDIGKTVFYEVIGK